MAPPPDQAPVVAQQGGAEGRYEDPGGARSEAGSQGAAEAGERKPEPKADEPKTAKAEEPRKPAESAAPPAPATSGKGGKFAVQIAAPASEKAARELADRLKKAGFTAYTEKVETKDGARHRVRVGPYATREDAEKARARLKSQGFSGNLVAA